jgi:hypothetical protein
MSEFSTPLPSGMRVRQIQTQLVNGKPAPVLDAQGQEVELWAVDVPQMIEAAGGAVVDGFVTDIKAKGADIALVRAGASIAGTDPTVAENAFSTAQLSGAAESAAASPGGKS